MDPTNDTVRDTASTVQDAARQVLSKAEDAAKVVQREASKIMDRPQQYFHDLEDEVVSYVRQKPIQSIAIAAAFGFIFGALRR